MPRSKLRWNAPAKNDNSGPAPVALPLNIFCTAYSVGRTKAYQLLASGRVLAKKMVYKTLIDVSSAKRWYEALPAIYSKCG